MSDEKYVLMFVLGFWIKKVRHIGFGKVLEDDLSLARPKGKLSFLSVVRRSRARNIRVSQELLSEESSESALFGSASAASGESCLSPIDNTSCTLS